MLLRFHIPINPRYLRHYHCRLQRSMAAVCCQRADIYLLRVQASLRRIRTKRRYSPVFSSDAAQAGCKRDRKPCRLYSELPSVLRCAGSYIDDETFLYSGLLSVGGLHEQLSTAGLQSIPAQYRRYRDHVGSTNEGKVSNNDRTHLPDRKMVSGFRKFRCVVVHILQVNCHLCVPERNRLPSKTTTSYHFTSPHGRIGNASLIPCRVHNICVLPYNNDISFTSLPTVITSTSNLPFYYLKNLYGKDCGNMITCKHCANPSTLHLRSHNIDINPVSLPTLIISTSNSPFQDIQDSLPTCMARIPLTCNHTCSETIMLLGIIILWRIVTGPYPDRGGLPLSVAVRVIL